MGRKFGIGIVGAGMAMRPHMKSLQDLADRVEVRGVYTRTKSSRDAFAAVSGFPAVESYEAMLADPNVDAILMMTPANARVELTKQAAAAGKHILMEKPLERTTAAALEIVETCEQAGVTLGVVFQHRYREASLAIRDLLAGGTMGDMASAFLVVPWWRGADYYAEPGRGTIERDGGGVLITQAVHSMDLMLSLTGPVSDVQAIAGTTAMHDIEGEDFVGAGLRFASGALGSLMATVNCFPGDQEYMVFNCTNATAKLSGGTLDVRWLDGRVEQFGEVAKTGGGVDPMDFPYDWHMANIVDFVDAVQNGTQPMSNGRTALQVHYLIDALMESARSETKVSIAQ